MRRELILWAVETLPASQGVPRCLREKRRRVIFSDVDGGKAWYRRQPVQKITARRATIRYPQYDGKLREWLGAERQPKWK